MRSPALTALFGVVEFNDDVPPNVVRTIDEVAQTRRPLELLALVVSPEHVYSTSKAELVHSLHANGLSALAKRISRQPVRRGELLCLVLDAEAKLISLPFTQVRRALARKRGRDHENA